jgi:hypothetical protein
VGTGTFDFFFKSFNRQAEVFVVLGDEQVEVSHRGGEHPWPVSVAVAQALVASLVALGSQVPVHLQLERLLHHPLEHLAQRVFPVGCKDHLQRLFLLAPITSWPPSHVPL